MQTSYQLYLVDDLEDADFLIVPRHKELTIEQRQDIRFAKELNIKVYEISEELFQDDKYRKVLDKEFLTDEQVRLEKRKQEIKRQPLFNDELGEELELHL